MRASHSRSARSAAREPSLAAEPRAASVWLAGMQSVAEQAQESLRVELTARPPTARQLQAAGLQQALAAAAATAHEPARARLAPETLRQRPAGSRRLQRAEPLR